ncbi:SPOR domain-containing protein [Hydrogenophaga sp.]|uniref:SPOR domain-containing protein n=1 Tax=Hydrogenophaga sp. TaxID=1904254 RepID=UPI003F6E8E2A
MSAPSQPAANAPESATTALYRAALGPVNTAHYLSLFARFDEAGRASPAWNWAAGLITLNWLAFRQVWLAALVYVACAEGLALLILGLARRFLHWPPAVEWGVLGALLALCIAIPGAYGNAWLHADTRRRMTRAVREARTVREACEALEKQASTRRRLWGLVALNALLVGSLVAGYVAWSWAPAEPPTEVTAPASAPVAPPAPPEPLVETPAQTTVEPATEPAAAAASEPAVVEVPREVVVEPPASEPVAPVPPPILAPIPKPPAPEPAAAASTREYAINVGLFADPANAEKAHARLLEEGLPAFTQIVEMPKGARTRVRVGPFADRHAVEAAAERIRSLGLEAQIYQP